MSIPDHWLDAQFAKEREIRAQVPDGVIVALGGTEALRAIRAVDADAPAARPTAPLDADTLYAVYDAALRKTYDIRQALLVVADTVRHGETSAALRDAAAREVDTPGHPSDTSA